METSLTTIPRASSAQDSLEDRKCHRSATVDTEVSHNDNDRSNVSVDQSDTSEEILIATERTIRRRRCILFFLLLSVITFVIIDFCTTKYIATAFSSLYHWVDLHPFPGAFMLTFVAFVSTLAFIPGAILTVGCGLAYGMIMGLGKGVVVGTVVVFAGAALGSELSFIFGRYLMRDCVGRWLDRYPLLRAVDVTMKGKGFRIFFLLRLSPIIPFNALNYMAGATAITFKDYTLSLIGLLPGTILYVFVGASAGSSMEDDMHGDDVDSGKSSGHVMTVRIASIVIGVVTGVLGVVAVSCYAKKELNKIIAEEGERDQEHESDTIAAVEDDEAAEQV